MKHEDITIVIPSLHPDYHHLTKNALTICLESLRESFSGEIKIAYNGEGSGFPQGQCNATNRVVKEVTTPWVLISNNDQVYSPGWFEKFTGVVENNGFLCASPNLVEPRKGAPPFIEKFCGGAGVVGSPPDFNKQCFLDFEQEHKVHINNSSLPTTEHIEDGFNLPFLIRKDVWDTIGGYDEAYDPWGSNSDSDLQYKIMVAGITPKRIRSVLVYHFSNTSGTFHPSHQAAWQKNFSYFTEKWGFQRANSPQIWYKPEIPETIKFKPEWRDKHAH